MKKKTAELMSWNAHIDKKYGMTGTIARTAFEANAQAFIIGELIKIERERADITQEQMAEKTVTGY